MREYKFRGKARISTEQLDDIEFPHGNGWVYGTYIDGYIINRVEEASSDYIAIGNWCPVIPETVGQYTGLKDKNGVEIYEGDIIKYTWQRRIMVKEVVFDYGMFKPKDVVKWIGDDCEVIGNIYENKNLLQGVADER